MGTHNRAIHGLTARDRAAIAGIVAIAVLATTAYFPQEVTPVSPYRVPVNEADTDDLQALPAIGPGLAHRIYGCRTEDGPFRDPEELKAIPGMSKNKLQRILPRLRFE